MSEDRGHCIGCGTELLCIDDDPNGDRNATCARCVAEECHDFDLDPDAVFSRNGDRQYVEPVSTPVVHSSPTRYDLRVTSDGAGLYATEEPNTRGMQYVMASAYDALAARFAELEAQLEVLRKIGAQAEGRLSISPKDQPT